MADPWDVYVSFMKMNGVPLLPPVLNKERRSEMQYYQLLAKEVESRISRLTPYCAPIEDISEQEKESISDSTICESPGVIQQPQDDNKSVQDLAARIEHALKNLMEEKNQENVLKNNNVESKKLERKKENREIYTFSPLEERKEILDDELPEKDNSHYSQSKAVMAKGKKISFSASTVKERTRSEEKSKAPEKTKTHEKTKTQEKTKGQEKSVSKKRISGSLIDLSHRSPERKTHIPTLQRQNSYTLLTPSPQLLAHLESRSQQTGQDATKLSMSDSQCSPKQKRRNWDLESAKVKWSNMAMELKQKNFIPKVITKPKKTEKPVTSEKVETSKPKADQQSQTIVRSKSSPQRHRVSSLTSRTVMRSEVKVHQEPAGDRSPPRRTSRPGTPSSPTSPKQKSPSPPPSPSEKTIPPQYIIGDKEDPSKKVRELFETIQKQQVMQMASLVEKQKREQMMLQQVFEEQNLYLSRQIKNICPEIEIRNVSVDAPTRDPGYDPYYGLSRLEAIKDTVSTYVYHYDGMLPPKPPGALDYRSIKYPPFTRNIITQTRVKKQSSKSPKGKKRLSKALGEDDDVEFMAEPVLSPVDDHGQLLMQDECNILRGVCVRPPGARRPCSPGACDKHGSVQFTRGPPKPKEDEPQQSEAETEAQRERERAAATCIVAHARGYLTRRLLSTAVVRGHVQTIRDALLCALQLHQDRGGIRGADVDLHRRLIQQITAACYAVHETVITNPIAKKMALIAADRVRQKALAAKQSATLQRRNSPTTSPLQRRNSPTASPLQRRNSPTASPLQRRGSPIATTPQRRISPDMLHHRASHTVSSLIRRPSPTTPSPALQRRGSPTFPLAARQSSPIAPPRRSATSSPPPSSAAAASPPPRDGVVSPPQRRASPTPVVARRPSPLVPTSRPTQKRMDIMSHSHGPFSITPYTQPGVMTHSAHEAGITVKAGRGHNAVQKQRWL